LIGPNEPRRWDVSSILADCRGLSVREFASYPTALNDVLKLLERYFDIILVDLDSDPEFAIRLIASICAENTAAVMVYSERTDRDLMARCMRAGAREYLVMPFDQVTLGKALERARIGLHSKPRPQQKGVGDLLVFLGAKGGAGVTTVACNLAIALAQEPDHRTLLIDLAAPLGDAALNLGIAAEYSTDHALREGERLDARSLLTLLARHRSGVFLLAAPSKVPEVEASKPAVDKLVDIARHQFDHVIVDVGSRIDLMNTDLFQLATTIYLVTQAGISELRNSNRLISQFFGEGSQHLEIVLNRYSPHLQSSVNEEVITRALGMPVRWKIPDDHDATRQMQSTAASLSPADSPISRLILEMASSVTGHPIPQHQSGPQDLIVPQTLSAEDLQPVSAEEQELSSESQALDLAPPTPEVPGAAPAIKWSAPDPITYGTPLGLVQLNATASVPGILTYTPGPGYVLPAGTHTLWVTFNPANSLASGQLQAAAPITVNKAVPAIQWQAPPNVAPGSPLTGAQLNAKATVPGEFVYHPAAGEVLEVGTHTLSVTFTPADAANYTESQASVSVNVAKQTPALQWPSPDPIAFGEPLSAAQLNAVASIPGELVYQPALGEVLTAGTHRLTVTLNPTDNTQYTASEATVTITVSKATPVIAWPAPDAITYGALLGDAQLKAETSVPGTFAYNPPQGSLLAAGSHTLSVEFTPADTSNYESSKSAVRLAVSKSTPAITWPESGPILNGAPLSAAQLNATATVPGTFAYEPSAGEVLAPGSHNLSVTFTPADMLNSTLVEATTLLTVVETSPTSISWPAPSPIAYGTPLGDAQLNATAPVPGSFQYAPAAGNVLAPGRYTLSAAFTPSDPWQHSSAQATVELVVADPAYIAPSQVAPLEPAPISTADVAVEDSPLTMESEEEKSSGTTGIYTHREIRIYKGAIYEKGDDGQWHLQQN
jgi:Flp pilus assembly CpaE family ATPase